MTLAEAIYQHSLALPEPAAREALDFIEFLEQRYGQPATQIAEDEKKRQAALAHIAAYGFTGKINPFRIVMRFRRTKMQITANLHQKLIKAVQTSMRIEGYKPSQSKEIKQQVKTFMEQHHVQVSVPRK